MAREYEIRWAAGRAYRYTRAEAMAYAATLPFACCVIEWGHGAVIFEKGA